MFRAHIAAIFIAICLLGNLNATQASTQENNLVISLFNPGDANNDFWNQTVAFAQEAASQLGIELRVFYGDDDFALVANQIEQEATRADRADAFLFPSVQRSGVQYLQIVEEHNVPSFVFNMGFDTNTIGMPRTQYQHWLGQMVPDDVTAGYELAKALIDAAVEADAYSDDGNIHMIGVTGRQTDTAANQRADGLEQAAAEYNDVSLHQVIPSNWSQDDTRRRIQGSLRRFSQTNVIWTASDNMAMAALDWARENGKTPNQNFFTGGVDWTNEGLQMVANGELTASVGGHFMEGGWSVVLLYDYLMGTDFAEVDVVFSSPMSALTADNVTEYLNAFGDQDWSPIDFRSYSRHEHPANNDYDFGLESILNQLR